MFISEKEFLSLFGWSDFFESHVSDPFSHELFPARIICEERNLYRIQSGPHHIFWATVSGKLKFNASDRMDFPSVGDWVMAEQQPGSDRGVIHQLLPRKTVIYRKVVGLASDRQILAANVDTIFITTSANEDLSFRRIERYLALAFDSGAKPVVLLTKADLYDGDLEKLIGDMRTHFIGVDVFALRQDEFESAVFLPEYLKPGTTSVMIGSSGVGKSTLTNYLIGSDTENETIKTQDVREGDAKGRHTTTSRHLYLSRFGGQVIDTPGMRELQLSDHNEGISAQFADIEALMAGCRFNDCQHVTEPGCAVIAALDDDSLPQERWQSYRKLEAEARFAQRKQDIALTSAEKKSWKKVSMQARERSQSKKRGY